MRTLTIEETNILGGGIWNPMPGEDPTMGMDGRPPAYTPDLGQLNARDTVWGNPGATGPLASAGGQCTETHTLTISTNTTYVTRPPGCTLSSGPPFISCSVGMPTATTTKSYDMVQTISCPF